MSPSQVLDAHTDLLNRLTDDEFRRSLGVPVLAAAHNRAGEEGLIPDAEQEAYAREIHRVFMEGLTAAARVSYTYRVSEDMVELCRVAADSLDSSDTWDKNLAPTQAGLMHFEKPMYLGDFKDQKRDGQVQADWMIWGPGPEGRSMIYFLGDPTRVNNPWLDTIMDYAEDKLVVDHARRVLGKWILIGWSSVPQGRELGEKHHPIDIGRSDWTMDDVLSPGASLALASALSEEGREDPKGSWVMQENEVRLTHAIWLMLNQTIVETSEENLERPTRRRAMKHPGLPGKVTTIALRRRVRENHAEGEAHVEWQHRWIVRGHWAWRRCSEHLDGAQEYDKGWRRRIWISPYEKGPEDKPLVLSEKVYDLRR